MTDKEKEDWAKEIGAVKAALLALVAAAVVVTTMEKAEVQFGKASAILSIISTESTDMAGIAVELQD